ncbi:MAG: hypothetical protein ABW022_10215 [Actinoplanes sp.]
MSDLDKWVTDLGNAPDLARKGVRPVVERGLLNIKRGTQRRWKGLGNAPALASAVTYDVRATLLGAAGEVGPDKRKRQGALGNVIEYGTVNNPPHPALAPEADAEAPRFARAMEDLGVKAVPQ